MFAEGETNVAAGVRESLSEPDSTPAGRSDRAEPTTVTVLGADDLVSNAELAFRVLDARILRA
jgi:hypothetical protein